MKRIKNNPEKCRRKILPGLGGIGKNYINKASLLESTLRFLTRKMDEITFENKLNDENLISLIKEDLNKLSRYKYHKKMNFYLLCQEILEHY